MVDIGTNDSKNKNHEAKRRIIHTVSDKEILTEKLGDLKPYNNKWVPRHVDKG